MLKLSKNILFDIIKNKVVIGLSLFLFLVSWSLFSLEENSSKATLSLMNIIIIVIPLISMIFTTTHYYNSYEYIELLLAQPLSRNRLILAEFIGIATSLCLSIIFGMGLPMLLYSSDWLGAYIIFITAALSVSCVSIALLISVWTREKSRGIGVVLMVWFYLSLIYDGLILSIIFSFSDYPLEKLTLLLSALNPIDLSRISIMLKMDVSALLGYTGALYKDFFGSYQGTLYSGITMVCWIIIPLYFSIRIFSKKDL
jgi:Cu-processing system permease protein